MCSRKRKVLFVIDSLQAGGAEKSICEIASRMSQFDPSIAILFPDRDELRDSALRQGLQIYDLSLNRYSRSWFFQGKSRFEKICRDLQPAVVHAHLFKSEMIARLSKRPASTALVGAFVNDSYSDARYSKQSFLQNQKLNVIKFLDKITIGRNFRITTISKTIGTSNSAVLGYPIEKVKLIYRGRETKNNIDEATRPDGPFRFLVVARLLVRKGYFELIEAARILDGKNKQFQILVAGDGVDRETIKDYASKKGISDKVEFLGYRSDVNQLLAISDCFVFPSHYEGQGGALIEAMLAAKPIVVSDIPVFKEQVTANETGVFFKVGDGFDLAKTMEWVMDNYSMAREMGLKARIVAEEKFNIEKVVAEYEQFYSDVVRSWAERHSD